MINFSFLIAVVTMSSEELVGTSHAGVVSSKPEKDIADRQVVVEGKATDSAGALSIQHKVT